MFWTILLSESLWASYSVIPSLRLRTSSDLLFCHSDPERSEGEESTLFFRDSSGYWTRSEWQKERRPFGTLRLRLRVTSKKRGQRRDDRKGVIPSLTLRISSGLRLRTASEHFFLSFWGSASDRRIPYLFLIEFLCSGQRFGAFSPSEWQDELKTSFPIGNFRSLKLPIKERHFYLLLNLAGV